MTVLLFISQTNTGKGTLPKSEPISGTTRARPVQFAASWLSSAAPPAPQASLISEAGEGCAKLPMDKLP